MRAPKRLLALPLAALMLAAAGVGAAEAQEVEEELGWFDTAELSYVATGGNAEAQTLSLRNTLSRLWEQAKLTVEVAALRAETTSTTRVAVGSATAFDIRESSVSQLTAESYLLRGRYDRQRSERLFWFAGAGWERNEFAGIKNRLTVVGGIGQIWFEDETSHFRTDYGITYTDQEDVAENPDVADSFPGIRLGWDYLRKFGGNTTYTNLLVVDGNLDETSDYRADMVNALSVALNGRLALKVSLQLLFDNEPSLVEVPLESGGLVAVPLDDLDTIFTTALVVSF